MKSILNSFNISLKVNSGAEIEYVVLGLEQDLKIVFDVFLEDERISNIGLDEEQQWKQTFGGLLEFEVQDIGFAIENYYQKIFSKEKEDSLELVN